MMETIENLLTTTEIQLSICLMILAIMIIPKMSLIENTIIGIIAIIMWKFLL